MPTVLAIDDDRAVLHLIKRAFQDTDTEVLEAADAEQGMELLREAQPDVALLDIMLPGASGLEAVRQIHAIDPKLPVIFITSSESADTAIEAMKRGAYDYLHKPLDVNDVRSRTEQALETRRLMHVPVRVSGDADDADGELMVGHSPQMLDVYKAIGRVAPQDVAVLIQGESGTGKELVARSIYHHSKRADGPFLAVNCAALSETLLESELFGHEKGSFTGADSRRIGKFEQCDGGTIFLDEVGDMSPSVQGKVLRLLQEQRFERLGGNETIQTDVRIVTATNRDLEKMVDKGSFRADLFYRLNGFTIKLPPLRERNGDVGHLLQQFLARFSKELGKDVEAISDDALKFLQGYSWPGNVRELQSVVKQSLLRATGPVLVSSFLPKEITGNGQPSRSRGDEAGERQPDSDLRSFVEARLRAESNDLYAETVEMMERFLITRVLRETEGNQSQAAKLLGITRGSLRNKIRGLGISIDHVVTAEGT